MKQTEAETPVADSSEDPEDSPVVRQVLYTNDVRRLVSGVVGTLFTLAEPERVRAALQGVLDNWDKHVDRFEQLRRIVNERLGE